MDKLDESEMEYIKRYDSYNSRIGYNSTIGGKGANGKAWGSEKQKQAIANRPTMKGSANPMFGKHHSEEARQKIREARLGTKWTDEMNEKRCKPVIQLTLDNKEIKEYRSLTEAAQELKCNSSLIMRVCQGKKRTAKGFHWKYKL